MCGIAAAVLAGLLVYSGAACPQPAETLQNWYDDPFFSISDAVAQCPQPAGPFVNRQEARLQEHHRVEAGTSCWLAGKCRLSNSYKYDAGIAVRLRAAFDGHPLLRDTSLWVTVQGRVVFIQGCAREPGAAPELEVLALSVPDVAQAVAAIDVDLRKPPPYRTMTPWKPLPDATR